MTTHAHIVAQNGEEIGTINVGDMIDLANKKSVLAAIGKYVNIHLQCCISGPTPIVELHPSIGLPPVEITSYNVTIATNFQSIADFNTQGEYISAKHREVIYVTIQDSEDDGYVGDKYLRCIPVYLIHKTEKSTYIAMTSSALDRHSCAPTFDCYRLDTDNTTYLMKTDAFPDNDVCRAIKNNLPTFVKTSYSLHPTPHKRIYSRKCELQNRAMFAEKILVFDVAGPRTVRFVTNESFVFVGETSVFPELPDTDGVCLYAVHADGTIMWSDSLAGLGYIKRDKVLIEYGLFDSCFV